MTITKSDKAMTSISDLLSGDDDAFAKAIIDAGGADTFLKIHIHDGVSYSSLSFTFYVQDTGTSLQTALNFDSD